MFVDTSFCVDLMREHNRALDGPATHKLRDLAATPLFASVFVICELQAGARLSRRPAHELRKVEHLADTLSVVYPDETFAVAYGEMEAYVRRKGKPIPTMDLLIGVTARSHGLPLLTRDPDHFRGIPGLVVDVY